MNNDDIIRLAIEHTINGLKFNEDGLLRFAKLIAQCEREACANICETLELPEWPDKVRQPLAQAIRARHEK